MSDTEKLRRFIVDELRWQGDPTQLDDDFPLLDQGVLDSMGIYRLVAFMESSWDVVVEDHELVAENFSTLRSISSLVAAKRGKPGEG